MKADIVFFDVAFTLIYPHPSVGSVYASAAREFGTSVQPAQIDAAFPSAWKQARQKAEGLPYGPTDEDARRFWRGVVGETFRIAGAQMPDDPYFDNVFDRFATTDCWRVYDDVFPALEGAKQAGLRAGVLSNFDSRLRPLLESLDLQQHIELVIISCEAGFEKPDPRLFKHAVNQTNVEASRAAMIGDMQREDIDGANAAGWTSILIDRKSRPDPPRRFASLVNAVEYLAS